MVSTGEKRRIVLKKEGVDMTDEEIDARFAELASLKIHPREEEENKLLIFQGERLYEDRQEIEKARERFRAFLAEVNESKWDDFE